MRRPLSAFLFLLLAGAFPGRTLAADEPAAIVKPAPVTVTPPSDTLSIVDHFFALGTYSLSLINRKPRREPPPPPAPAGSLTPSALSAAPPPPAAPPDPIEQLDALWATSRETVARLPEAERPAAVAQTAIAAVEILTQPPPPDIDPTAYDSVRNQVGRYLNRVGSDADRKPYEASLKLSENVLGRDPNDRDALNNTAGSQYGLGRYREAAQTATRITERHNDDERAYTTRALANYQMKEFGQAFEDAQLALALNPKNETAFQIAKLAKPRMTTAADLGLDQAGRKMADQVRREYEANLDERGRAEAATVTSPRTPAQIDANQDRSLDHLRRQASQKIKLGDFQGAADTADLILTKSPGDPDALQTRASVASLMGDYQKALDAASAALERRPNHPGTLLTRAEALSQLGRHPEALLDADRAVSLNPNDSFGYKTRSRIKQGLGDLAGMDDDLRRAAHLGPRSEVPPQTAAVPSEGKRDRLRSGVVLASSIIGGLLVAWGLFHVGLGAARRPLFPRPAGASTETAQALAAAGGLGAGYEIVRTLGAGGMGVVYEAMDKALERRVAIKKMRDEIRLDERERSRFLQEARIVAQLHHPNIVEIHTIVSEGTDLYLVFEYVEGHTIDQILQRKGRLSVPEAQWVLHGVAKALDYSHKHGVVHRDLKPSNIMMESDGTVKVMDFGIARQAKDIMAKSTMTGTVAGTPQYMAPEQEEGVVRPESDVFSMGAMLYEMVTGQRPYPAAATTASKINKRYEKPSRLAADLPPALEELIIQCLEPDPEKRPRSAAEFRARLDALKVSVPAKSA